MGCVEPTGNGAESSRVLQLGHARRHCPPHGGHRTWGWQHLAKAAHGAGGAAPAAIPGLGAHRKGQPGAALTHP